jgi:hypothetical protein
MTAFYLSLETTEPPWDLLLVKGDIKQFDRARAFRMTVFGKYEGQFRVGLCLSHICCDKRSIEVCVGPGTARNGPSRLHGERLLMSDESPFGKATAAHYSSGEPVSFSRAVYGKDLTSRHTQLPACTRRTHPPGTMQELTRLP